MSNQTSIYWFRQDLRLRDNAALTAALGSSRTVIPLYVWSHRAEGRWSPGERSRWWLHHSLAKLSADLESMGMPLVIRRGPAPTAVAKLARQTGATGLYLNRRFEPEAAEADQILSDSLAGRGINVQWFSDTTLFDPEAILTKSKEPFKVFTPFWKQLLTREDPGWTIAKPRPRPGRPGWPAGDPLSSLGLLSGSGLEPSGPWHPGEAGALKALRQFLNGPVKNYQDDRDRPDITGTSRLSPHLHFGELSPRRVWHEARKTSAQNGIRDVEAFLRQLAWREFSYYLLFHFPATSERPWRDAFKSFPWRTDRAGFRHWSQGETGYPLVDAGMRELAQTGWMHNRVRLVTASFLTKHLLIHWLDGAVWFWRQLVDADLANNTMGWQWTAGSGADAAPYFRIFNPVLQGQRYDPGGEYVRRWLPELARLPDKYIQAPWTAPAAVLKDAGIQLGRTYPRPVVDHTRARARALAAYQTIKSDSPGA